MRRSDRTRPETSGNYPENKPMMWVFLVFMVVYGLTSLLFAFVEPPEFLRSMYKVPAIFVFLPDRWVMPAGRVFVGLVCLVGAIFFALRVIFA
jgi:hypothetical protein